MTQPEEITAGRLLKRLAGTRLPANPVDVHMPPGSDTWPRDIRARLSVGLTPAGVLVPVFERASSLTVLLTERAADLKHHAGQISFPGGRMEAQDRDILVTALREAHEEVGIAPADVSVVGYLDPMPTSTGYAVTPVIGMVASGVQLTLDQDEVAAAFEVPLPFLLDRRNARPAVRQFDGREIPIVEFRYEGRRIWGATAHILLALREKIL